MRTGFHYSRSLFHYRKQACLNMPHNPVRRYQDFSIGLKAEDIHLAPWTTNEGRSKVSARPNALDDENTSTAFPSKTLPSMKRPLWQFRRWQGFQSEAFCDPCQDTSRHILRTVHVECTRIAPISIMPLLLGGRYVWHRQT